MHNCLCLAKSHTLANLLSMSSWKTLKHEKRCKWVHKWQYDEDSPTRASSKELLHYTRWAWAQSAPAARAAQAAAGWTRRARPRRASAAVPLVKQTAGESSCSAAHTAGRSLVRCPSGGRRGPVLRCAHGGTDTRGHYTRHESHSEASSAFSWWTKCRYLLRVDSAGLPCRWTGSSVHLWHAEPGLDYSSNRETEKLVFVELLLLDWGRFSLKVLTEGKDKVLFRFVPLDCWSKWCLQYNFPLRLPDMLGLNQVKGYNDF